MYHEFYAAEVRASTRIADARRTAHEERLATEARAQRAHGQRIEDIFRALIARPRGGHLRRLVRLAFGLIMALVLALAAKQAAAKPISYHRHAEPAVRS